MAVYGEVIEVQRLTPTMVRVVLGGEGLAGFTPTEFSDQYVNALFVPEEAPYSVPFDVDEARALDPEHRPRGRRYTVRSWDPARRELTLDFVVHGDVGHAGRWATNARPGDLLQFTGPSGSYSPDPAADAHLMVGDESALPAIGASLERVPEGVPVQVVALVDDQECRIELESPGSLEVTWVHRCDSSDTDELEKAVEALALPEGRVQVFVHGEAAEVRAVRRHLLGERGVPRDGASISPYWRRNHTDEEWRQIKKAWIEATEADIA